MLRLVELALFLAPIALFAAWRFLAMESGPSPRVVVVAACLLVALAGMLIWLSREHAMPPGSEYVPAQLQDGRVVSGHATSP
jgi:Family of unknown function (DUF6111)